MILSDLKDYLQSRKRVVMNELVMHFGVEADALRGMLSLWVAKGKVKKLLAESACGTSCCKCDPLLTEIYEWQDKLTQ